MRIHANTLTIGDVYAAARHVDVTVVDASEHGSRSRARAFEVTLAGSGRTGGQWANSGKYGAADHKAATWDEWGIFLATLFAKDDTMTVPRFYESAERFHWATGDRYRTLTADQQHLRHKWNYGGVFATAAAGSYTVHECACGALTRRTINGRTFADLSF